jgi:hypothetical protein
MIQILEMEMLVQHHFSTRKSFVYFALGADCKSGISMQKEFSKGKFWAEKQDLVCLRALSFMFFGSRAWRIALITVLYEVFHQLRQSWPFDIRVVWKISTPTKTNFADC